MLLHAIRDLSLPKELLEMIAAGEVNASRTQLLQDSADIILGKAKKEVAEAGVTQVETVCLMGDPAMMILDYARQQGIALIVLGHRGLGPHGGLLGSVARKIANMADVSCLIVT